MFTGIISDLGEVNAINKNAGDWRFSIRTHYMSETIALGASIACDGCCLTVVEVNADAGTFAVDVSAETLSKTTLGEWVSGRKINLERSLKAGDELGGHIVSGHVDGLAEMVSVMPEGDSHRLTLRAPESLMPFIASKGSVALNGISLTVNDIDTDKNTFEINIIPHTWEVTNISDIPPGGKVNLEIDMLARYVARIIEYKAVV